jgi:putative flippase GtrA
VTFSSNWNAYRPSAKLVRFLVAGLPGLLVAVALNLFLLSVFRFPGPLAYAVALVVQVTVNFFACLLFVFERDVQKSIGAQFLAFVSGIFLARAVEWVAYVGMTEFLGVPYLVAQLSNAAVFSVAKFAFARHTIEGSASTRG